MKKLLIATGIASAIAMTGCASNQTAEQVAPADHPHKMDAKKHHKKGNPHQGERGEFQAFQCENDAKVKVHFLPEQDAAKVRINAPSWSLDNVNVDMTAAVAASGQRFVNELNQNAKYEWHSKADMGVLSVTNAQGETTSLNCEAVEMKHPSMPPKGKAPAQPVAQ